MVSCLHTHVEVTSHYETQNSFLSSRCDASVIEIGQDLQKLLQNVYCHVFMDHSV